MTNTPTPSPTPTPTPEPVEQVKLTVKYYEGDEKVFPDEVIYYKPGSDYYVVSPQKPGYDVDIEIVRGTIGTEDMVVIVRYTPKVKLLTLIIRYIYQDGKMAATTHKELLPINATFDVPS